MNYELALNVACIGPLVSDDRPGERGRGGGQVHENGGFLVPETLNWVSDGL